LASKTVSCTWSKHDRYGRILARCTANKIDIGLWMVQHGWAIPYRDCKCETYRIAAEDAQKAKRGIWTGSFLEPWIWRRSH
jgi:endonuclease YncB( thermonuclease family)